MSHEVLVGKVAPNFVASAVMPNNSINDNFDLTKYLDGDNGVLFSTHLILLLFVLQKLSL